MAIALTLSGITTSCGKDDPDNPYSTPETPNNSGTNQSNGILSVSPASLSFPSGGGSKSLYVSNGNGANVTQGADWIKVSRISDGEYVITASVNYGSARQSYVKFTKSNSSESIIISQDGESNSGGGGNNSGNNNKAPEAPTGLTASPEGPSSYPYALLKWNSSSGATKYTIYRSTSAYGSYTQLSTSTTTSYSDQQVKYGSTYYYKVKASNANGTSDYSSYAVCEFKDKRSPGPVQYGNCTVSGTTMTLRWSIPKGDSYGTPTKALLRVKNTNNDQYTTLQTLSGTATSVSFSYTGWVTADGYVYAGIILENENGSGGGIPKIYDTKNKRWMN